MDGGLGRLGFAYGGRTEEDGEAIGEVRGEENLIGTSRGRYLFAGEALGRQHDSGDLPASRHCGLAEDFTNRPLGFFLKNGKQVLPSQNREKNIVFRAFL